MLTQVFTFLPIKTAQGQGVPSIPVTDGIPGVSALSATKVPVWDWNKFYKDLAIGAARGAANAITTKFLNDFTAKLVDKYKIRNFLYYDRVLSNYYLTRYIADNVSDPDLRQVFTLMERAYISGQNTGTDPTADPNAPDPRRALIPRLNAAISQAYINRGGLDPQRVYEPASFESDREYFAYTMAYFSNPISFTQQNLQADFGAFQSSATTASQLEILVGNGLKAGRIIGGTCSGAVPSVPVSSGIPDPNSQPPAIPDPNLSPEACRQARGTWQPSLVDQARSFIDNPAVEVDRYLLAAIQTHVDTKFNPNNFWAVVGSHLGRFLMNKFLLDRPGDNGVLPDSPFQYSPIDNDEYLPDVNINGIDIDNDGIIDGYDLDGDGIIDSCAYGGTAPDCTPSGELFNEGEEPFDCSVLPPGTEPQDIFASVQETWNNWGSVPIGDDLGTFLNTVAWNNRDAGWGLSFKNTGDGVVMSPAGTISHDVLHHQPTNIHYDVIGSAGSPTASPAWLCHGPMTDPNRPWVAPVQP